MMAIKLGSIPTWLPSDTLTLPQHCECTATEEVKCQSNGETTSDLEVGKISQVATISISLYINRCKRFPQTRTVFRGVETRTTPNDVSDDTLGNFPWFSSVRNYAFLLAMKRRDERPPKRDV